VVVEEVESDVGEGELSWGGEEVGGEGDAELGIHFSKSIEKRRLYLQLQTVEPPAGVAREDSVRSCESATAGRPLAGESCDHGSALQIPDLLACCPKKAETA